MNSISKQALERVARIYKSNKEASQAIGMHPRSFARLCRQHDLNGDRMRRDPFRARDDLRPSLLPAHRPPPRASESPHRLPGSPGP